MFHLKEGWFFERLPNGSVMVTKRKDAGLESPIITRIVVLPEEWASVVAAVSAAGEFNGRWQKALDFHSGLTPDAADKPKSRGPYKPTNVDSKTPPTYA
ncbi:MAG: hypothetical protein L0287_22325 [Anaerolineae bacterium]|nr:hypothetical protein [Anaerolineae bacterium]